MSTAATTTGNALAEPKTTSGTIARWLDNGAITRQIVGALAGYMDGETFKAQCALAARDPNLAACDPTSLFAAFLLCAQMGLLPGKQHGHVALIPRKQGGVTVVDVMPQWQGYLYLMRRQSGVRDVRMALVHETDTFAFDSVANTVRHEFKDGDPFANREFTYPTKANPNGGLRGGYLRAEFTDGRVLYHLVPVAKILRNMACAQSHSIWQKWFPEMAQKSVIRDAWARRAVPIDPETEARVGFLSAVDDKVLGNDPARAAIEAPPLAPALGHEAVTGEVLEPVAVASPVAVAPTLAPCPVCQKPQPQGLADRFGCPSCNGVKP